LRGEASPDKRRKGKNWGTLPSKEASLLLDQETLEKKSKIYMRRVDRGQKFQGSDRRHWKRSGRLDGREW